MNNLQKIKWGYNRWTQMNHPKEDWYRVKQQFQYRIKDRIAAKFYAWNTPFEFIGLKNYRLNPIALKTYLKQQDIWKIKIFNLAPIALNNHIHWRKDPKTKIISPLDFTHKIDTSSIQKNGEYKYLLELNRFHHFPTLAAHHFAYEDQESFDIIQKHLQNWKTQNPYLKGINWKSGIEVAIRAINWVYARQLLQHCAETVSYTHLTLPTTPYV